MTNKTSIKIGKDSILQSIDNCYMKPGGKQFLIKDKHYMITSCSNLYFKIDSEYVTNHGFKYENISKYFRIIEIKK